MEEKKYPKFDDEGVCMCNEPSVSYAATGSGYANTIVKKEEDVQTIPVGRLGFYTQDQDVFDARIAEIEAEVERAEQGDESDWMTAEEFDKELKAEFPWLQ